MSQFPPPSAHRTFDIKNALEKGITTDCYSPQFKKNDEEAKCVGNDNDDRDGTGLFSMYLKMAREEDRIMANSLKADADRVLIFSGLFSAVVTAFLTVSVQDLRPDPQDKPTFYLENIYQLLADSDRTDVPTLPTRSRPPAFSPPRSAVWVHSLWSLSLVIALSSALLAILLQQWVRRYIKVTQPRSARNLHKQARKRAFFDKGIQELRFQWAADVLPILLHASLLVFLAGLVVFSFGSSHIVFKVVASWVGLCALIYSCFTLLPILRYESPYYTPLSPPLWFLYTGTLYVVARILQWLTAFNCCDEKTWVRFGHLKSRYRRQLLHGMEGVAEEYAQKSTSEIDRRILLWTLQTLDEDYELERSFANIPDFCSSTVLEDPLATFKTPNGEKMTEAVVGLMARTLSSDLLPHSTKQRRIMICNRAITEASLPIDQRTLERVLYNDWSGLLDSVEFGLLLRNARYRDPFAEYYSQCVVSVIIAKAQEHDDRWFELATDQLGISKATLQYYLANGDSTLIANCVFICRRTMQCYSEQGWNRDVYSRSKTLELVSRFNIQDALPELQHEFCDMWNELVRNAGNRHSRNLSIHILKHIRNVYCGLHQGTSAAPTAFSSITSDRDSVLLFPQSYPLCTIAHHHPAKEKSPDDVPSALNLIPVATAAYTPRVIPVDSEKDHVLSILPFRETFGGIKVPRSPSYLLRRICDRRTETASSTSNASTHAPSASLITLHPSDILETSSLPITHDASLTPTSSTGHVGTAFADMQSMDNEHCILQQCISVAPPARAVLRGSIRDNRGVLAKITHGTTRTPSDCEDDG
ncbi:hypothetical protein EDB86DRAFT_3078935 [Lactarius hatsudake]|nr:hypothetical protein EDB86DRAFT_3078935 [Lactarius hatsudake]